MRNTPTEGFGMSPAQQFLGRRCKTRLPTQRSLLAPRKTSRSATLIAVPRSSHQCMGNGETVYMRLPGQSTRSRGMCTGLVGPRSYGVPVGEREFRRNRRYIIRSSEPFRPEISVPETTTTTNVAGTHPAR